MRTEPQGFQKLFHRPIQQRQECYAEKTVDVLDGVEVNIISLKDLKLNKQASGRLKDLNDLENLE
ncbi:MAG: hypothetical protein Fur0046_22710 [Cyanobacteria bacterium J069]